MRGLIVEDKALDTMEIESMLSMAEHDLTGQADDLATAIAAVDSKRPDLALVDIKLARCCSGLDVTAALKTRGVPVIFATGNRMRDRGNDLALGCLHKPFAGQTKAVALAAAAALLDGYVVLKLPKSLHFYKQ